MASKKPLNPYRGTLEIDCEVLTTSESAARDRFMKDIRPVFKDIKVRKKVLTYIDEGMFPR